MCCVYIRSVSVDVNSLREQEEPQTLEEEIEFVCRRYSPIHDRARKRVSITSSVFLFGRTKASAMPFAAYHDGELRLVWSIRAAEALTGHPHLWQLVLAYLSKLTLQGNVRTRVGLWAITYLRNTIPV
jgi:hypothetical protein